MLAWYEVSGLYVAKMCMHDMHATCPRARGVVCSQAQLELQLIERLKQKQQEQRRAYQQLEAVLSLGTRYASCRTYKAMHKSVHTFSTVKTWLLACDKQTHVGTGVERQKDYNSYSYQRISV